MSTHALITTTKTKDLKNYKGVYVHYDGYPEGLGDFLITAYKEEGWTFIKEVLLKNEWGSLTLNESNEIDYQELAKNKQDEAKDTFGKFKFHEMDFGHQYIYNFYKDEKEGMMMDVYKKIWVKGWQPLTNTQVCPSEFTLHHRIMMDGIIKWFDRFDTKAFEPSQVYEHTT
jgi:hypothetical protein